MNTRTLRLHRDELTDLTPDDLHAVVGAGTVVCYESDGALCLSFACGATTSCTYRTLCP